MRPIVICYLVACALVLSASALPALANVPAVGMQAPATVTAGDTVPVEVSVSHAGTAPGHFVDSVRLYDGDKLLKEWAYGPGDYEKAQQWTLSYDATPGNDAQLKAVAHCTLHGDGSGTISIAVA